MTTELVNILGLNIVSPTTTVLTSLLADFSNAIGWSFMSRSEVCQKMLTNTAEDKLQISWGTLDRDRLAEEKVKIREQHALMITDGRLALQDQEPEDAELDLQAVLAEGVVRTTIPN